MKYAIIENWNTLTQQQKQDHRDASAAYTGGVVAERLSLDGTKALLNKSDGAYNEQQIKDIMKTAEWSEAGAPLSADEKRQRRKEFASEILDQIAVDNEAVMTGADYQAMLADPDFAEINTYLAPHAAMMMSAYLAISAWTTKTWISDARRDGYKSQMQTFLESIGDL